MWCGVWLVEMARSSQEQQQLAAAMAARDNMALYQIYQRYAHDPALLQRQLTAYLAKSHDADVARMTDASHLVYHFASKITACFIQAYWITTTTTTVLRPFVRDYPGESIPEV